MPNLNTRFHSRHAALPWLNKRIQGNIGNLLGILDDSPDLQLARPDLPVHELERDLLVLFPGPLSEHFEQDLVSPGFQGCRLHDLFLTAKKPLTGSVMSGKRSLPRKVAPMDMILRFSGHFLIPPPSMYRLPMTMSFPFRISSYIRGIRTGGWEKSASMTIKTSDVGVTKSVGNRLGEPVVFLADEDLHILVCPHQILDDTDGCIG